MCVHAPGSTGTTRALRTYVCPHLLLQYTPVCHDCRVCCCFFVCRLPTNNNNQPQILRRLQRHGLAVAKDHLDRRGAEPSWPSQRAEPVRWRIPQAVPVVQYLSSSSGSSSLYERLIACDARTRARTRHRGDHACMQCSTYTKGV